MWCLGPYSEYTRSRAFAGVSEATLLAKWAQSWPIRNVPLTRYVFVIVRVLLPRGGGFPIGSAYLNFVSAGAPHAGGAQNGSPPYTTNAPTRNAAIVPPLSRGSPACGF